ncbi:DUF5658 family protein [Cellulosilyticum sp. I15G10I2]|uniref:DUF5658 family protein n=1 Tax=Cellulosilyticum sp. I15G10I2 TaxID=1892843 RepID=UPI00085C4DC0|nr:DUF5658 family protein [Cellulosilyticum sp. I15G10I2]
MAKSLFKHSMTAIKTKFTLIYILNCTDMLFTYTLLKTGHFYEANLIMRPIVSNPFLSILVKIIFPAVLILAVLPHLKEESLTSIKLCTIFINIVILAYLAINILHVYYLINILFFL